MENDYKIDRQAQRTKNYTGIVNITLQDAAMTDGMGPILDRTREHLGSADTAIIAYRRMLLRLVHEYQAGIAPGPAAAARSFRVLSTSVVLPRETPWVEAIQERIQAVSEYMPA